MKTWNCQSSLCFRVWFNRLLRFFSFSIEWKALVSDSLFKSKRVQPQSFKIKSCCQVKPTWFKNQYQCENQTSSHISKSVSNWNEVIPNQRTMIMKCPQSRYLQLSTQCPCRVWFNHNQSSTWKLYGFDLLALWFDPT